MASHIASRNFILTYPHPLKSSRCQRPCHTTAPCLDRGRCGVSSTGTRVPATSWYRPNGICQRSTILQPKGLGTCSKLVTNLLARSQASIQSGSLHLASPWTETTVRGFWRPFRTFPGPCMLCCCVTWFRSRSGTFLRVFNCLLHVRQQLRRFRIEKSLFPRFRRLILTLLHAAGRPGKQAQASKQEAASYKVRTFLQSPRCCLLNCLLPQQVLCMHVSILFVARC